MLPHLKRRGGTYFVTFREAGTLPREVLLSFKRERQLIIDQAPAAKRPLTWLPRLTWIMFLKFLDDLELQREDGSKVEAAGTTAELDALLPSLLDKAFKGDSAYRCEPPPG